MTAIVLALVLVGCSQEQDHGTGPSFPREPQAPGARQTQAPEAPRAAPGPGGQDHGAEVKLLFRVVACGGDTALPAGLDAGVVEEHCRELNPKLEAYRKNYLAVAEPFLAKLRPEGLPASVVYPFGGGDLLAALVSFPDATEYTTLSLEHAGDPRRLAGLDKQQLAANLALVRQALEGVLTLANSTSETMSRMEKSTLPGQLCFFLVALRVHGFEPTGLRYFRLEPDGGIHYLVAAELTAQEGTGARKLNPAWASPAASEAFSNAELLFRQAGAGEGAPRVHRHIAANLADRALKADERVLKHLAAKGKVAAMTKAASYTLWNPGFSRVRSYLLENMVFMLSDSTGVPPRFAKKAGFVQETYGHFAGPFLDANAELGAEFAALWKEQPQRELPFRYGYPDSQKQYHLLVTKRAAGEAAAAAEEPEEEPEEDPEGPAPSS
jgi:hypothetical protein